MDKLDKVKYGLVPDRHYGLGLSAPRKAENLSISAVVCNTKGSRFTVDCYPSTSVCGFSLVDGFVIARCNGSENLFKPFFTEIV